MPDLFVSYASANEALVRRRLEPLRDRGFDIWFAPDRGAIPGGTDYADQIVRAIGSCKALLLMATSQAFDSDQVSRELEIALNVKKLAVIPLMLQENLDPPPSFQFRLSLLQYIQAITDSGPWVEAVETALHHHGVVPRSYEERRERPVESNILPYFADRDTQEQIVIEKLTEHLKSAPHRPIVFVVHGTEQQCCDGFVDRLVDDAIPTCLASHKNSNELNKKLVRWPERSDEKSDAAKRAQMYRRSLLKRLELPLACDDVELMRHIGKLKQPISITSIVSPDSWQEDETELLAATIKAWGALPDVPAPSQPVIVLMCISYHEETPSMLSRILFKGSARGASHSWSKDIEALHGEQVRVYVLPQLTSLSLGDAEDWVREVLKPSDPERVKVMVRAIFRSPRKEAEQQIRALLTGPPVERLIGQLDVILKHRDKGQRLPMEPLSLVFRSFLGDDVRRIL